MKRLVPAIGLAGLLYSSCLPVPFDLSLSKAAALTAKMTKDNPSLIDAGNDEGSSWTEWAFYPSVSAAGGFDYKAGFATATNGASVDVRGVSNGFVYASSNQPLPANLDSNYRPYLLWPLKPGAPALFGTAFDASNPSGNGYGIFYQGTQSDSLSTDGTGYYSLVSANVIGASVAADPSPAFDTLHILAQNGAAFMEVSYEFSPPTLANRTWLANGQTPRGAGFYPLPFVIPSTINQVLYYYDVNSAGDSTRIPNRSFVSWYDSSVGGWVCYAWDSLSMCTKLPLSHRIDALLSTGQLLSTENGTARLYDRDGNLLATFDLENLVYIAEEYVGGQARCYFSQCLIYDGTVHFNVYWISTNRLPSLGN